jgi:Fe-S cluster biogenesis protein NfuA
MNLSHLERNFTGNWKINRDEPNQLNLTIGENIMKEKVEKALQKVRPMLQADGGDVELVDVQDGIVTVRLQGACGGCPMSQMTLKNGIEKILKKEVPEVVSVESAP